VPNGLFPNYEKRACKGADTNIFFDEEHGGGYAQARAICAGCRVIVPCRDYAIANEEHGYWGGTSPTQRVAIRGFHIEYEPSDIVSGQEV
jgi:hypothetical protein